MLITLSGRVGGAALGVLMSVVDSSGAILLDVQQFTVRDVFTISANVDTSAGTPDGSFLKDLLLALHPLGVDVSFDLGSPSVSDAPSPASVQRAIVTVIAPICVPAPFLADVTDILASHDANIESINRITERGERFAGFEFIVRLPASKSAAENDNTLDIMRAKLLQLEKLGDISLQRHNLLVRSKRLVVFDLSWTLVQGDSLSLFLSAAGVDGDGESSGVASVEARVALLRGYNADLVTRKAVSSLRYTDGAVRLCTVLKKLGYRLAVISSGAQALAEAAKYTLHLDYAYGNQLLVDSDGNFSGSVKSPVIDADRKAELLQMLAMQESIELEQVVAIGDGPVSSKMLSSAGLSISFDQVRFNLVYAFFIYSFTRFLGSNTSVLSILL